MELESPSDAAFAAFAPHRYCQLVTFRRSGAAVPTPVWFALDAGGRLVLKTELPSGKVRRIRRQPRVQVAPCSLSGRLRGAAVEGVARLLAPDETSAAEHLLAARYGAGRRLFGLLVEPVFRWRGRTQVYLAVEPARGVA